MNHLCIGRKYGKYGCGRLGFPTGKLSSAKGSRCLVAKMAELLSFGDLTFTVGVCSRGKVARYRPCVKQNGGDSGIPVPIWVKMNPPGHLRCSSFPFNYQGNPFWAHRAILWMDAILHLRHLMLIPTIIINYTSIDPR